MVLIYSGRQEQSWPILFLHHIVLPGSTTLLGIVHSFLGEGLRVYRIWWLVGPRISIQVGDSCVAWCMHNLVRHIFDTHVVVDQRVDQESSHRSNHLWAVPMTSNLYICIDTRATHRAVWGTSWGRHPTSKGPTSRWTRIACCQELVKRDPTWIVSTFVATTPPTRSTRSNRSP